MKLFLNRRIALDATASTPAVVVTETRKWSKGWVARLVEDERVWLSHSDASLSRAGFGTRVFMIGEAGTYEAESVCASLTSHRIRFQVTDSGQIALLRTPKHYRCKHLADLLRRHVLLEPGEGRIVAESQAPLVRPVQVELLSAAELLLPLLAEDPRVLHQISADLFEDFVCERLGARGLEARRTGRLNRKDGGIDIVFWPRSKSAFPFLGAAQVKHHRDPSRTNGAPVVRDFAAAVSAHSELSAGLLVTNTSFTPDAEWFAREKAKMLRLRGFRDVQAWIFDDFATDDEWREIPEELELCPGVKVRLR